MLKLLLLVIITSVFCNANLFTQYNNKEALLIDRYSFELDSAKTLIDSFKLSTDSILAEVKNYGKVISVKIFLKDSGSILFVNYFLKNSELILVKVKEQSPKFYDLFRYTDFYFEKNKIFYEDYSWGVRACMIEPKNADPFKLYSYNKNLHRDFLRGFIFQLFDSIKSRFP
jgi:phage terminase large subunit-like protein